MRALFSTSMPRLATAASLVALCAGTAPAYDEDAIQDQLQPYFGVWLGMYQVETIDMEYALARGFGADEPRLEIFNPVVPAGGISLGVAYGRMHVGVNAGYQLRDGDDISKAIRDKYQTSPGQSLLHKSFQYEVIPIDANLDLAILPNEYPINLLIGGSVGIGLVNIQNPVKIVTVIQQNADGSVTAVDDIRDNSWSTYNFTLATAYVGGRINLARRLNLEGQLGYRVLSTDGLEGGDDAGWDATDSWVLDSTGVRTGQKNLKPLPVDLSGAYIRVDLRWTFASKADREREARIEQRRKVLERLDARFALKD